LLNDYFQIEKIYLYSSYAKDSFREDSGIDVAIWKLRRRVDDRIEPILTDRNQDRSGCVDEIKRNGIEIV